jgi:hypothetical protein
MLLNTGSTPPVAAFGHTDLLYQVPNTSSLIHQHVFAQAIVWNVSTSLYSNGLRLTVGGVLP